MSTPRKPFRHKPLKGSESIRLLRILSSEQVADVMCSIVHVPFIGAPKYEALSYVWGSNEQSRTISCDGASLAVTENLYQALLCLQTIVHRLPTQDHRYIWAYGICINQDDPQEKGEQVLLMHRIYNVAQKVIIWLGEAGPLVPSHSQDTRVTVGPRQNDLLYYLSHPYWYRVWTLQEILYSKRRSFLLGDTEMDWDCFWDGTASGVAELGEFTSQPQLQQALQFYTITSSVSTLNILLKDPTLAELNPALSPLAWAELRQVTNFAKGLRAADPRDMIYSLSGLISSLGLKVPPPDYTKPAEEVFRQARNTFIWQYIVFQTGKRVDLNTHLRIRKPHRNSETASVPMAHASMAFRTRPSSLKPLLSPLVQFPTPIITLELDSGVSDDDSDSDENVTSQGDIKLQSLWQKALKQLIDRNKRLLLGVVLDYLNLGRHGRIPLSCNGDGQNQSNTGTFENQGPVCSGGRSKKQKVDSMNAGATWCHERSGDDYQDDDDDDLDGRPRKLINKGGQDDVQHRFACPYFQRNSQNPQLHRSCCGPGFQSIHRLK